MNKLCPNCNFTVGPMVYMPASGRSHNVLYCMNCGWTQNITAEEAAAFESKNEDVSLNDHQWLILCNFMLAMIKGDFESLANIEATIRKELAALHVRSEHPREPFVSGVSAGLDRLNQEQARAKDVHLDLEQRDEGSEP